MENVVFPSNVMLQKGDFMVEYPKCRRKLVLLRRLGRWQVEMASVAKEMSVRLDSLSAVEKPSDQS